MIEHAIKESIEVKQKILEDKELVNTIKSAAEFCIESLTQGGKILLCGNGGSAADAQHIAAELTGRFEKNRKPLFAEALHVNSSYMTAVANDYDFETTYSRLVEAKGKPNDVLIAISTSGNSKNILKAAEQARKQKMSVIGFTGRDGGALAPLSDLAIKVPSQHTTRIQEAHILIGHILCEVIERSMFP